MTPFRERLAAAQQQKGSSVCVGLDPRIEQLPQSFASLSPAEAILEFSKRIIEATADVCVAVKPQAAFYEAYGPAGVAALVETVHHAQGHGLLVILDAKRGDMGTTAEAYAHACLDPDGPINADALTVNAYLGSDGVQPFLERAVRFSKGVFVLVKTSNPSSGELQDRLLDSGEAVFEAMARLVDGWDCEAVVGGTYPAQAARARTLMPRATFLVPGYGAQGGGPAEALPSFRKGGSGAIVSSSRSIIFAPDPRRAAIEMRDALNVALSA